jgi:ABC-type transporter Mla maintaining outer membrane lipid asymmetry ATPase subunit MlaF
MYIKDIFKASVCSFFKNIYEYDSIDVEEFIKSLKLFLREDNFQKYLETCALEATYDIKNIENICDNLYLLKNKKFEEEKIINICKKTFIQTIEKDKTINIEAFVDNLEKEFSSTIIQ